MLERFEAFHVGHVDVENDHVVIVTRGDRGAAIGRFVDREARVLEVRTKERAD